jgi:hypothetical protein
MTSDGLLELRSPTMVVRCRPAWGFAITALEDPSTGINALWTRRGHEPAEFIRSLGAGGDDSTDSFLDRFVGGWFDMFPSVGHPGVVAGIPTQLHGEVPRLPWTTISADASHVEARVRTLRTPFEVVRRLEVHDDGLLVKMTIKNVGRESAPYAWGFHPCFDRAAFAGGRIHIDADSAEVPAPAYDPANSLLRDGQEFTWPNAVRSDGSPSDVSQIPLERDGRQEHVCLTLRTGKMVVTAPTIDRWFALTVEPEVFPYVLLWEDFGAAGASFWGEADVFTLEPSTNPGRGMDDAVRTHAVRTLGPREEIQTSASAAWGRGAPPHDLS